LREIDFSRLARAEVDDWAKLLPSLIKLVGRLVLDPRVPRRNKAVLLGVSAYVLSPIDIIPDSIKLFGQLDDLAMVALALRAILTEVDERVVLSHWDGNRDLLELVQAIIERSTQWLPEEVLAWLQEKGAPGTVDGQARPLAE
jgi:uncharacterized membrane protein YkvA (DUF1232 family)